GQRAAEHAGAGVRNAHGLEQPLDHTVLAVAAMQDVEHAVETTLAQRLQQRRDAIHRLRVDAARAQRLEHVAARVERDLALGTVAAHQHRHAAEHGRIGEARRRDAGHVAHACASLPMKPSAATCWATWPMSPAPIISSRSPSWSTSGSTSRRSATWPTTTGSLRPRARIARARARESAPGIGASPAG